MRPAALLGIAAGFAAFGSMGMPTFVNGSSFSPPKRRGARASSSKRHARKHPCGRRRR